MQPDLPARTRKRDIALFLGLSVPLVFIAYRGGSLVAWLPSLLVAPAVAVLLGALSAFALRREGRSLADLGLSRAGAAFLKLLAGFAGGLMLVVLALLALRPLLPFHWELNRHGLPIAMAGALAYHLVTNTCEELAFRGYSFLALIRRIGHWPAQFLTAGIFALFHVACGWPWEIALFSTTVGAVLFGLIFLRWRSLPMAVGAHAAWNWGRDLLLGGAPDTALLSPVGMAAWTPVQWQAAQAVLVGTMLAACVAIRARPGFASKT